MKEQIKETASGGSVGAGSVATAPSRLGAAPKKRDFKSFLVKFYDGLGNKMRLHPVNLYKLGENKEVEVITPVTENFNIDSVLAQLSNFENATNTDDSDVVSYGVEDHDGNMMKVTILNTQAEDFEAYISAYLSELKNFENSGVDLEDISLAELLYKLKDLFDIRDVEFPNIPEDVVYNADEASDSVEDLQQADEFADMGGDEGMDEFGGEEGMDEFGGEEGMDEFGGEGNEFDEGGEFEEGDEFGGEEGFEDDESVEDFEEFDDETGTQSLLNNIIDMLRSQAEKDKAQYEAEAEEARAKQAEYSARAAEATLHNKEELIAMQAEKDDQKKKEKEAKKQADLATYRYKQSRGMLDDVDATFEGFGDNSILMGALLNEEDIILDPTLLRRQFMNERKSLMDQIRQTDNPDEKKALQRQLQILPRKFMLKRQEAEARGDQKVAQAEPEDDQNNPNRPMDPRSQQMNQAQSGQFMESDDGFIIETITEDEYNKLDEGAKRQFKRYGNSFKRKFRCYGGPKDGRMVSKAADCGIRKDPFKVRQGKRSARRKKGQRVRKTRLTKRKAPSQRLTRMNKILRGEHNKG